MELAGFAIGVFSLAVPLAQASLQCYRIFDGMSEVGNTHDLTLHELRTEGARLRRWEEGWGLAKAEQPEHPPPIDPADYRYRHAVATLARIVVVFASVGDLHSKYGIRIEATLEQQQRRRDRFFKRIDFRSPSTRPAKGNTNSQSSTPAIPAIKKSNLQVLENPQILQNPSILPGLEQEISTMSKAIAEVQQSLSVYRKLRWVISDRAEFEELLKKLKSLNDGLYNVLPVPASFTPAAVPNQNSKLTLLFDIPFRMSNLRQNANFVEREDLIDTLRQKVATDKNTGKVIVLCGTGGMGKTQLALEYVYRFQREYSSVFWVNVTSKQTAQLGFTEIMKQLIAYHVQISGNNSNYVHIGQLLGMPGKLDSAGKFASENDGQAAEIVDAVKRWFTADGNDQWLLVLDNLDDLESFSIDEYIPCCNYGTVIITSRRRESTQGRRAVEIQEMQGHEAMSLLLRSAQRSEMENNQESDFKDEYQACVQLVAKLGCLPLALDQAGSHIYARQYSFRQYLTEYERKVGYFLKMGWKIEDRNKSVFSTWELSFEAIQRQNPQAAKLLSICGHLNNEDICEELLRKGMRLNENDTTLDESIHSLISYSMVKRKYGDNSFSIHPLVHEWARRRLEIGSDTQRRIAIEALEIVTTAIHMGQNRSTRRVQDWIFERRTMPHVIEVSKLNDSEPQNALENSHPLYVLGLFYRYHGQGDEAFKWMKRALAAHETSLDPNRSGTLEIVRWMGVLYADQGKYDKALKCFQRALAGQKKLLGPDHPDTIMTVENMSVFLHNQEKFDEALEGYQRALAGREKLLGPDHPDTLWTVNNMSVLLEQQGKFDEALNGYQRALAGREKLLGPDHPDTLWTVNDMSILLERQGKFDEALDGYQRALAGREKLLGPDHPDTLRTVNNMSVLLEMQGKYDEALDGYQRALAGREKSLGPDNPDTLLVVNNISVLLEKQGKFDEGLKWAQRALAGLEKSLGPDNPDTLLVVNNISVLLEQQGKFDEALEGYQRALAGREKLLGPNHPDTLLTVNSMSFLFEMQGKFHEAQNGYTRSIEGLTKILGETHPELQVVILNLIRVHEILGENEKANIFRARLLSSRK